MERKASRAGPAPEAEWPIHGRPLRITPDEIARAARELVSAYGADAVALMRQRTRAVRLRGDPESAMLWLSVARAAEEQLADRPIDGAGGTAD